MRYLKALDYIRLQPGRVFCLPLDDDITARLVENGYAQEIIIERENKKQMSTIKQSKRGEK